MGAGNARRGDQGVTAPVRRVAIVGAESTGKSVLAAALAAHFNEPWAVEAVRAFWDTRGGDITPWDLATIARGQIANEEVAASKAERVVFCDTDLITNVMWADELYDGQIAPWVREAAAERVSHYALHLWCEPDLPWEPDPQRCFADRDAWWAAAARLRGRYEAAGATLVPVRGAGADRTAAAIAAVEAMLAATS